MKHKKTPRPTPEESLRHTCEEGMGLDLNYNEIRDRLDTAEIARVGRVRKAAAPAMIPTGTAAPAHAPRRAVPAVLLVLAVLILTPALAVGSFLIARSTMDPTPPDETVDSMPPLGTSPDQSFTPNGSVTVAPRPIPPNTSGEAWGNLFNLTESYATDNALFLRAEHLDPAMTDGSLPAVLTVSDMEEWKSFCGEFHADGVPSQELLDGVNGITREFFQNHSLQVIVTEGRSGSIRYRLEEVYATNGKINRSWELVAEVPLALTMDIVHWCVVIPVSKAEAQVPMELSMRDVYEIDPGYVVEAPDDVINDIIISNPNKLWFDSQSYVQGDCLIGEIDYTDDYDDPSFWTVNTLAEWQKLYDGCAACYDEYFLPRVNGLNAAFFAEKSLLILRVSAGSGSYRHRVDGVAVEGEALRITLTTLYHEVDTCDMAAWAILIPIDKAYSGLPVELVTRQRPDIPQMTVLNGYVYGDTIHGVLDDNKNIGSYSFPKGQIVDSVRAYQAAVRLMDDSKMPIELIRAMRGFDEAFFKEKALLILYLEKEPAAVHYEIDTLTVTDGRLMVGVYGVYPEEGEGPGLLSSGHRVMLVPIDKELRNLPVSVYLLK